MNNLFFKNSLFFKAESILKEFIENFEKIEHNWDKFTELKVKVAMFSIFKKNWDIYEKILIHYIKEIRNEPNDFK